MKWAFINAAVKEFLVLGSVRASPTTSPVERLHMIGLHDGIWSLHFISPVVHVLISLPALCVLSRVISTKTRGIFVDCFSLSLVQIADAASVERLVLRWAWRSSTFVFCRRKCWTRLAWATPPTVASSHWKANMESILLLQLLKMSSSGTSTPAMR